LIYWALEPKQMIVSYQHGAEIYGPRVGTMILCCNMLQLHLASDYSCRWYFAAERLGEGKDGQKPTEIKGEEGWD